MISKAGIRRAVNTALGADVPNSTFYRALREVLLDMGVTKLKE